MGRDQREPGATANLTLELEGTVDLADGTYRFDLLPQVMARPDRASVTVGVDGGLGTVRSA